MAKTTDNPWEASAWPACPTCGQATVQLVDGLCVRCWRKQRDQQALEQENARLLLTNAKEFFSRRARARLRRIARGEPLEPPCARDEDRRGTP